MIRLPPRATRTDTPFPYTTLFRSPLAGVGVLELVDQRHGVLRAQLAGERVRARAVDRIGDAVDQVVVGLHALLLLGARDTQAGVVAQAMQQLDAARVLPLGHFGQGVEVRSDERRVGTECVRTFRARWAA